MHGDNLSSSLFLKVSVSFRQEEEKLWDLGLGSQVLNKGWSECNLISYLSKLYAGCLNSFVKTLFFKIP